MTTKQLNQDEQKALAGKYAVETLVKENKIFSGMKIGLGTGSTAMFAVQTISDLIKEGKLLHIKAVPTSRRTALACEKLGIPIFSLNAQCINGALDLAIDGADEIDSSKNLIKGGGAALLFEKIIAYNSKEFIVIADESKKGTSLGNNFPLPIEVIPEAMLSIVNKLKDKGLTVVLREDLNKQPALTDSGNFILDVKWPDTIKIDPAKMETELNKITGVVENGLFTEKKPRVFIAHADSSIEDWQVKIVNQHETSIQQ